MQQNCTKNSNNNAVKLQQKTVAKLPKNAAKLHKKQQ